MSGKGALVLVVEGVASLALLGWVLVILAFAGEAHRRGVPDVQARLQTLALALGVLPLVAVVGVGTWALLRSRGGGAPLPSWIFGAPAVVLILATVGALGAFRLGGRLGAAASEAEWAASIEELRRAVEAGRASPCALVAQDPRASAADMAACRARIERLVDRAARWAELGHFVAADGRLATFNVSQVGLAAKWDWNAPKIPSPRSPHQAWFIHTYFAVWLEEPGLFAAPEARAKLLTLLNDLDGCTWDEEAREAYRRDVRPLLAARLAAEARWADETPEFRALLESRVATTLDGEAP